MLELVDKQIKRRKKLKYTMLGFNQIEAIKMGLSTDDLTVLRWFMDYKERNIMARNYIEKANDMGFWVDYATLIDALPILLSDGQTYLERFLELEQLLQDKRFEEYKLKRRKYHNTNRKRVARILEGPLSQILKKGDMKIISEKGSKIFIYVDRNEYEKLLLDTKMEDFLQQNGIDTRANIHVDNVDNVDNQEEIDNAGYKSVPPGGDTSVPPGGDTSVPPGGDTSVPPGGDTSVPPDSSIIYSSFVDSSIKDSSIIHSGEDGIDLTSFYELNNEKKYNFLLNHFDISLDTLQNIITVTNMGVDENTIKSTIGSKGYWTYVYKICKNRYKKSQHLRQC
ncbi:MAG: hypothetical protein ACRCX2_33960 [Paraclostridium sp.]